MKPLFASMRTLLSIALIAAALFLMEAPAYCKPVAIPIRMDYALLRAIVIDNAFTGPGNTMIFVDPADPCWKITLSDPTFREEEGMVRSEMRVRMVGTVGDGCFFPIEWDGFLVVHQSPAIDPATWQLTFPTAKSRLLDRDHKPVQLMGELQGMLESGLRDLVSGIGIPLKQPVQDLTPLLLSMVPAPDVSRAEKFLNTLRPGAVTVTPAGLNLEFLAELDTLPEMEEAPAPGPLSPRELDDFIDIWQTYDAFLVETLLTLSDKPLADDERNILFEVLLDTRYRFVEELSGTVTRPGSDFVREQFVWAWERLSPVLRRHLGEAPSENPLGYLSFFTAADALSTLDQLGPVFNVEISRDGLIRLIQMLSENKSTLLNYSMAVDPGLRTLLNMGPPLQPTGPGYDGMEIDIPGPSPASTAMRHQVRLWLAAALSPETCEASQAPPADMINEVKAWLVTREGLDAYFENVRALLQEAAQKEISKGNLPEVYQELFPRFILATAWQESCFRQFVEKRGKVTSLRSYNNTSVGIMQVNERVWRGLYDVDHLRWDIRYNADAGVQIAFSYLTKYALPKVKKLGGNKGIDNDTLASAVYAMYNSGPGGFAKYLKRRNAGKFLEMDRLFRQKYIWVRDDQLDKLSICLFGG